MVVRFEYSKDFKTWTDKIDDKRIEDYTVLGSYDVRQGYNLSEIPRASTFSMDVVSSYELAQALLEYRYIRIYRDSDIAFVGQLTDESVRKIETTTQQVLSIKYIHLLSLLEDVELTEELKYTEGSHIPVMEAGNQNSLVYVLVNKLFAGQPIPFEFDNSYSIKDENGKLIEVILFSECKGAKIWAVLNELLRVYGYIARVENQKIVIVDILEDGSKKGIELLDGAEIVKKDYDVELVIPDIRYMYKETVYEQIYEGRVKVGSLFWIGGQENDLPLTFSEEKDKREMLSVSDLGYYCSDEHVSLRELYLKDKYRTAHRKFRVVELGYLSTGQIERIYGNVTYAVYGNAGANPSGIPAGFRYDPNKVLAPKYLYSKSQVERYANALARIKMFQKAEWKFYSKVKMPVDTIVRFKDIPDSTCRIFEVQDTLELDGGYTYRAYPFSDSDVKFENVELEVEPIENYIERIYPKESIFVENGKYRNPKWRIYIKTANYTGSLKVEVNHVPQVVFLDSLSGIYCIEVALTDIDLNSIEVSAVVGNASYSETIPIYKTDTRPVIQEYRYSMNSTDPNADAYRLEYNGYRLKFGAYSLGYGNEPWTERIPTGSKYENMYLWKRTWNYNISEWVYELLTPIIEEFSIYASTNIYPISRRQVMDTTIILKVIQKGIQGKPVVTASDGLIAESGKNQWTLTLPSQFAKKVVTVTATLKDKVSEVVLNGVVQKDDDPVYIGIQATPPTEVEGKRVIEGDYYLTDTGVPKVRFGNAWKDVESTDNDFADIMDTCAKDWLLNGHDINESVAALYAYFGIVYSDAIITKHLDISGDAKKFHAVIKGEKENSPAVFDVQYDRGNGLQTIFKIVPSTGRIFMGRPNANATAPESGFMYDPNDDTISTKGSKFKVDADGRLMAEDVNISGTATITKGVWKSQLDCASFSSLPAPDVEPIVLSMESSAKSQYLSLERTSVLGMIPCEHSLNSNIKYISHEYNFIYTQDRYYSYQINEGYKFLDEKLSLIGVIGRYTDMGRNAYVSLWDGRSFNLKIYKGAGDIFKFKNLPKSSSGLKPGQVWVDSNGNLKLV